jgi:hypothetical protein
MRRTLNNPSVREILNDLRETANERHRAAVVNVAIGTMAATSTLFAGAEILSLGALIWRLTDLILLAPLFSALTLP